MPIVSYTQYRDTYCIMSWVYRYTPLDMWFDVTLSWTVCKRNIRTHTDACWSSCCWLRSATGALCRSWTARNTNMPTTWTRVMTSPTCWSKRENGQGRGGGGGRQRERQKEERGMGGREMVGNVGNKAEKRDGGWERKGAGKDEGLGKRQVSGE